MTPSSVVETKRKQNPTCFLDKKYIQKEKGTKETEGQTDRRMDTVGSGGDLSVASEGPLAPSHLLARWQVPPRGQLHPCQDSWGLWFSISSRGQWRVVVPGGPCSH